MNLQLGLRKFTALRKSPTVYFCMIFVFPDKAAHAGHLAVVQVLLAAKADVNAVDSVSRASLNLPPVQLSPLSQRQRKPLQLAEEKKHKSVIALLSSGTV